jgi:hypothetical protein
MVPPIDPGGYAVDVVRSCYATHIDFGDGNPIPIQWYRVPDDTPDLPYETRFVSRNWETYREWLPGPGEIYLDPRPWKNCARARSFPLGVPIGTPEQWRDGITPGTPYVRIIAPGVPDGTQGPAAGVVYPTLGYRIGASARTRSRPRNPAVPALVVGVVATTSGRAASAARAGLNVSALATTRAGSTSSPAAEVTYGSVGVGQGSAHATGTAGLALAVGVVSTGHGRMVASGGLALGATAVTGEGHHEVSAGTILVGATAATTAPAASEVSGGLHAGITAVGSAPAATAAASGLLAGSTGVTASVPSVSPHLPLTVGVTATGRAAAAGTGQPGTRTGAAVSSQAAAVGSGEARVSAGDIWQTNAHAVATGEPGIVLGASAATTVGHSVTVSAGIILDRVDSERENVVTFTCGTLNGAGTLQGTAAPIVSDTVLVTPTALNTGVILPAGCYRVVVWNLSATVPLLVYPPTGARISNGSTNAALTVSTGAGIMFVEMSSTQWRIVTVS